MTDFHDFFHQFFQVNRQLSKNINECLTPLGLYSAQWTIIYYLKHHGSSTQAEICKYLNVEAPTMTRTVSRLEKKGLIERTRGKDKREKRLQLTDDALSQFQLWKEHIERFEACVLKGISVREQKLMMTLLQKMNENINNKGDDDY